MSYLPRDDDAHRFYENSIKSTDMVGNVYPWNYDIKKIRDLLTALACPVPCAGTNDHPAGWHAICELKADRALELLGLPAYKEPDPTDHWSI